MTPRGWLMAAALAAALAAVSTHAPALEPPTSVRNHDPEEPVVQQHVVRPLFTPIRLTGEQPQIPEHSAEQTLLDFANLHTAGNYAGAELLARDLIALIPDHPDGYYNLACALARQRKIDEALESLREAVERGWRQAQHMHADPDLDALRGDSRYASLITRITTLFEQEDIVPAPYRTAPPEVLARELDSTVPALLRRYHVPGIAAAFIANGEIAWVRAFGRVTTTSEVPLNDHCRVQLRRPVELLTLMAAANESSAGRLDLGRLLHQADDIGLRVTSRPTVARAPNDILPRGGTARLIGLSRIAHPVSTATDWSGIDWYGDRTIPETIDLIMLCVELTSDSTFSDYCDATFFEPAGLAHSRVIRPAINNRADRQTDADDKATVPDDQLIGHTRFGTPVLGPPQGRMPALDTTVHDLAALVCLAIRSDSPGIGAMISEARTTRHGLGLSIDQLSTGNAHGQLVYQFAELDRGVGVLARWLPAAGRGIVVVFNSENGPEVATRIAQQMLGGE